MIDDDKIESLFGISSIFHVSPVNDTDDHITECIEGENGFPISDCKCDPEYKFVEDIDHPNTDLKRMLVIHNSFDGREAVEWANEILNVQ